MQVSTLPSGPIPTLGAGPVGGLAPVPQPAEAVAAGLAAIAAARTAAEVHRAACALAGALPRVGGTAVLRQDDRGLLGVAHAAPAAAVSSALTNRAAAALHQRWIAAHAPGAAAHLLVPFAADGRPDLLVVPLVRGDELLGALVLVGRDGRSPVGSQGERIAAGAIGVTAAQALETVALRGRLDGAISRAEHEAELTAGRKRLSRELHDGPAQDLALAGLALDRLVTTLGEGQAVAADARQARDLIDRAVLGMRKSISKLRVVAAPAPSITGPLRQLLAEMAPAGPDPGPEFEVDFGGVSGVRLAPEVERALVGIVREALHNVRKHAQADTVRLEVRRHEDDVEVAVIDDGVGFAGPAGSPPGHFGLEQIRELAEETGGRVDIGSREGAGTAVRAWIPLPKGGGTTGRLGRSAAAEPGRHPAR